MPYIPKKDREAAKDMPKDAGDAAYKLTDAILEHLHLNEPLTFATLATAIGIVECVKLELYRRVLAPYEDYKRMKNGDVYVDKKN